MIGFLRRSGRVVANLGPWVDAECFQAVEEEGQAFERAFGFSIGNGWCGGELGR